MNIMDMNLFELIQYTFLTIIFLLHLWLQLMFCLPLWEFIFFGGNKLWSMSINGLVKYIRPRKLI